MESSGQKIDTSIESIIDEIMTYANNILEDYEINDITYLIEYIESIIINSNKSEISNIKLNIYSYISFYKMWTYSDLEKALANEVKILKYEKIIIVSLLKIYAILSEMLHLKLHS